MPTESLHLQPSPSTSAEEITDETLMDRIQQRDESALTILYERHHQLLLSVISRSLYDMHHGQDVLQEVFVEIWGRADHYSPEKGRALGWLITMARRRALDRVRRFQALHRAAERLREKQEGNPLSMTSFSGDAELEGRDLGSRLEIALAKLPKAQEQAVRLAFHHGMSQREIVAKTGIPLGTIKTRIELGIAKLRKSMWNELEAA